MTSAPAARCIAARETMAPDVERRRVDDLGEDAHVVARQVALGARACRSIPGRSLRSSGPRTNGVREVLAQRGEIAAAAPGDDHPVRAERRPQAPADHLARHERRDLDADVVDFVAEPVGCMAASTRATRGSARRPVRKRICSGMRSACAARLPARPGSPRRWSSSKVFRRSRVLEVDAARVHLHHAVRRLGRRARAPCRRRRRCSGCGTCRPARRRSSRACRRCRRRTWRRCSRSPARRRACGRRPCRRARRARRSRSCP